MCVVYGYFEDDGLSNKKLDWVMLFDDTLQHPAVFTFKWILPFLTVFLAASKNKIRDIFVMFRNMK